MKARRFGEVKKLVASPEFGAWWQELALARLARDEARDKYDELLTQVILMEFRAELAQKNAIDTLYQAGEFEDGAATMMVEYQELENESFKLVSDFETQRYQASESWYRFGAQERRVEELRERLERARAKAKESAPGSARREAESVSGKVEADLKLAEKSYRQVTEEYERENGRKDRLWQEVERIWARTVELSLLMAERKHQGNKVRREAEKLFHQAEERKQRGKKLREEADAINRTREASAGRLTELLKQARERFGCACGEEFVYFRSKEDQKRAFCVPLVDDSEHYNIEIKPLTVYSIERQRGVSFIEPAVEHRVSDAEGDRRFEEYFLAGRKGKARDEKAPEGDRPREEKPARAEQSA
jgi:hypothetical protein